jgi:tetratricopeptide (TPR) repeat protein
MRRLVVPGAALLLACVPLAPALAQAPQLMLPKVSPRASVSQAVGLTDITITYDRPAVNAREVWGKLVPYDAVWRAGANENSVISFSSPVKVGGQPVPAGRYGLHMIPSKGEWTVILSRQANAWGTFTYDSAEDVVRVKAQPAPAEFRERLEYTLADPGPDSVVAVLRWEKLAVPIPIAVDSRQVVVDSLRTQLRGLAQFFWQPWSQAAAWCLANEVNLDEALAWANKSLAMNENFATLRIKAALLDKRGESVTAADFRKRAFEIANEADMNGYGYQLMNAGKVDSAILVFRKNTRDYPKSWNTYDSLGEAYAKKGDKKLAIESYGRARAMVRDSTQQKRIDEVLRQLKT